MKILFLNKIMPLTGVSTHQIQLIKGLVENGHEIFIISGNISREIILKLEKEDVKYKILRFPQGRGISENKYIQLLKYILNFPVFLYYILKLKPDIIHIHWPILSIYGKLVNILTSIPFVLTHHISGTQKTILYSKANKVIATCNDLETELLQKFNYNKNDIEKVYNGIDVTYFSNKSKNKYINEKQFFNICHIGSINDRKGIPTLIAAFINLKVDNKRLILKGDISSEYYNFLNNQFNLKSLNIIFENYGDPLSTLNSCDCYVLASLREGFVLTPLEAMACETVVVRSNCEGVLEQIPTNAQGFIFKKNDVAELTKILKNIYLMPGEDKEILGMNARKHVVKHFSSTKMVSKISMIYEELIND